MPVSMLEQHAAEAAFLWHLHGQAARDPHYRLRDLAKLDQRVEANVDALRIGGDEAWEVCKKALGAGEAGEYFAAAAVATDRGDLDGIAAILDGADDDADVARGIAGGLEWIAFDGVSTILPGLLDAECPPLLQELGLAASAAHRRDPGESLVRSLFSESRTLRIQAMNASRALASSRGRPEMAGELKSEDAETRLAAALWLGMGGVTEALGVLFDFVMAGGPMAVEAAKVAARKSDPAACKASIQKAAKASLSMRAAIVAAGALGDPELVPWLIESMASARHARVAAESLVSITGVDLLAEGLKASAAPDFDAGPTDDPGDGNVTMDPDENLVWPDRVAVAAWWRRAGSRFRRGERYLMGKPIDVESCKQVLREGFQRQRASAAIELSILSLRAPFPVTAPAFRQKRLLADL